MDLSISTSVMKEIIELQMQSNVPVIFNSSSFRTTLILHSGTRPTASGYESGHSTLYRFNDSGSLVYWQYNANQVFSHPDFSVNSTTGAYTFGAGMWAPTAATRTGTAEWFSLQCETTSGNNLQGYILGDVGLTGSGADLEVSNVNVVTDGTQYSVTGLTIAPAPVNPS